MTDHGNRASTMRAVLNVWLAFPLFVLVAFATLVGLDVSGSSISLLVAPAQRVGLLAGEPRPIRTDETLVQTPISVSSAEQGFPASPWIGLAQTDQVAVAHGGPTRDWSTLFKPQDWGYLLLGPSRGLAFSWWWSFAISLWGCFALFAVVTKSPSVAALLAVAATFTPYSAWWTAPPPSLFVGYAAGIGAMLIAAWSAASRRTAAAFTLGAAALSAAFALALYPPWQVSLAWVIALLCLGVALDRRLSWARIAWTTGATVGLVGVTLAGWYMSHSAAITAMIGTHYPGNRVSQAGGADLAFVLDAPLNFWMARHAGKTLGTTPNAGPWANLSEAASSWLSLPVMLLVAFGCMVALVSHIRARRAAQADVNGAAVAPTGPIWTLTFVSVAAVLLLAWAFLPLPNAFGVLTLLDRAEPTRVTLALGLAALLQVALASRICAGSIWSAPWLIAAAGLTGIATIWSDKNLPWNSSLVPDAFVVVSGVVLGACFALLVSPRRARAGAGLLAIFALASWSLVNPLQQGLGGVLKDPLVRELRSVTAGSDNPRVEVFGSLTTVAKVRIAGLQSLGGVTLYPDGVLMSRLTSSQESLWNNYIQYLWSPEPSGSTAAITQVKGTLMTLHIDPCDPVLLSYADPGWAVSAEPFVNASCMHQVSVVQAGGGQEFRIYQLSSR